jgi:hypothetical protein
MPSVNSNIGDIKAILLTLNSATLTQASDLTIVKSDDSSFKVYIVGDKQLVIGFYTEVQAKWQAALKKKPY